MVGYELTWDGALFLVGLGLLFGGLVEFPPRADKDDPPPGCFAVLFGVSVLLTAGVAWAAQHIVIR